MDVVYAVFAGAKNGDWRGAFLPPGYYDDITGAILVTTMI